MICNLKVDFSPGDEVMIDKDPSIKGSVLGITISGKGLNVSYQVSWLHSGSMNTVWVDEWRISPWKE